MTPRPIFDDFEALHALDRVKLQHAVPPTGTYPEDLKKTALANYRATVEFLTSTSQQSDTFNAYRREVDRFLIWLWNLRQIGLDEVRREDLEEYILFCEQPHPQWIGTEVKRRFIIRDGVKVPNEEWKPFVVKVKKTDARAGKEPDIRDYALSSPARAATMRILGSYFRFLVNNDHIRKNPIIQLSKSFIKNSLSLQNQASSHTARRLTKLQVAALFDAIDAMREQLGDAGYERLRFLMACMLGMYLRISEVSQEKPKAVGSKAAMTRQKPKGEVCEWGTHGCFHQSVHEQEDTIIRAWWFQVLGKGNKIRNIPVSDGVLNALMRYRSHLGLAPLPSRGEERPLFPKLKGQGGISSTRHLRSLVQTVFDRTFDLLVERGIEQEAHELRECTAHWLRHTGISIDVAHRPLTHVRESAGHSSLNVTGLYIDTEAVEAYLSAKESPIVTKAK